jgi:hypothetical protein
MDDLMKEMANRKIEVQISGTGNFNVTMENAREEVSRKFPELIQGAADIAKCVANPDKFALTLPSRILMSILATAPKTDDEKELFKDEQRFVDASEKANDRLKQSHAKIASYRSKYALLEANHFNLMGTLSSSVDTRESRMLFEEAQVSRESMTKMAQAIDAEQRAISTYEGDVDAAEDQLLKLRAKTMTSLYDPTALLLSSLGVQLPETYDALTVKDRKTIKDALQDDVLGHLSPLTGVQGGSTTMERAMFPKVSSVFAPSVEADFVEFKSTEASRVIQLVYKLALEMEQLRNQSGSDFQRATRVYDLSNDSVIVTSNPLQREVHLLNLISLAGYDPERWAQAFGVPISGIGKQILSAWGNGSKGPLKPEDIRTIFRGDRDRLPYDLDYTSLSYASRVAELRSINRDVRPASRNEGVPNVTFNIEDEAERDDEQLEA